MMTPKLDRLSRAEIDLSAIRDNIKAIRARVGGAKIMPAVKANGYGHGAVEVARTCLEAGADALCIAQVEEGIELREAGIESPILIMSCCVPEAAGAVVRYDLASTVCEMGYAKSLAEAALGQGKVASAHVKIDTGMGRLGVVTDRAVEFVREVNGMPGLRVDGLFTHFPCSDEPDREFTLSQVSTMSAITAELRASGIQLPMAHASNSGGILAYPEADFDAVRPGIMIYGLYPSADVVRSIPIREALTLVTRIVFLKDADCGATISYGRTHTLSRRSKIATLPIGYGDGYSRLLSNRGEALVRGARVPVVGRVCMDQIMIDVTDVPGVEVGDVVTLYGGGHDYLSVSTIAQKIGTIPYEVLCNIGTRVQRVYLNA